jgi:hypothetical protein
VDEPVDEPVSFRGGQVGGSDNPLRLGAHVPDLPGGAVFLHRRQHPVRCCVEPRGICFWCCRWYGVERLPDHELHGVWAAEHLDGLGEPCPPLIGQAAGFVFGFARFQSCLLGQLQ